MCGAISLPSVDMEHALIVNGLKKRYGDRDVVNGVSFSVKPGEIFGFLGPNGAGKTTTIRMIIGEIPPDEGTVEILGMPTVEKRDAIKEVMGVVPDHQNLYDRLTVWQNLDLFARLYGLPENRIKEVIGLVGLEEHMQVQTVNLSRGLRQRCLIARGILHRPRIFFLDEPTSALDPHSALAIRRLIDRLRSEGTTIFLTTHYMEEANSLCDRIAILHQGKIVAIDTPEMLRVKFGRATMAVTLVPETGRAPEVFEIPLNDSAGAALLANELKQGRVLRVHSQEATLEEVFLKLTGDQWKQNDGEGVA